MIKRWKVSSATFLLLFSLMAPLIIKQQGLQYDFNFSSSHASEINGTPEGLHTEMLKL
jgi:hypothetical protein